MATENQLDINQPKVGEGVFLIRDVSEILLLPQYKVRYWLIEFWEGRFSKDYRYSLGSKENRSVNFYTLVEFYTFYHLKVLGLSSQKIQKYHDKLANELNSQYPFARTIHTDGKSLWYEALGEIVKLDGKKQLDLKSLLIPFLKKIEFDSTGLAKKYFPLDNSKNVVIDPEHQFGQPTIFNTNIKTSTIQNFFDGGESVENICNLYELNQIQVNDALLYYKRCA